MAHGYGEGYQGQLNNTPQYLLQTIQHCEANCEHMITVLLSYPDIRNRYKQIQLLRDCADMCTLMSKYLARNTALAKSLAEYCAYVCELCGTTCSQFPDPQSQQCAQTCLHCSKECKEYWM